MCGFAGEYLLDEHATVDANALIARAKRLRHRGPDAVGHWCHGHVGLAHARLTLLDSARGQQPMRSPRGTVLAYNGEIYNAPELRAELAVRGYCFATHSDTEVVLAAFDMWGARAWERFNGMFALALYDPPTDELHLVRDRFGIKPLFYRKTPTGVEFGSEPSAWPESQPTVFALNAPAVLHFLKFAQPIWEASTMFDGLYSVEAGVDLTVSGNRLCETRWSTPGNRENSVVGDTEIVARARLRHLLHLAVGRQLVAEAPVGAFLSGGIDSAILVGLAAQMIPERLRTFSIALEGDEEDIRAARLVTARWNCCHDELIITPQDFFRGLAELVHIRRWPAAFPNDVLIYLLAKRARESVKVVLTGEGADELFGGYTRILTALHLHQKATAATGEGEPAGWTALRHQRPFLQTDSESRLFASLFSWFPSAILRPLLRAEWREVLDSIDEMDPFAVLLNRCAQVSRENRFHLLLLYGHLPNLLARLDGATMAASIEGRVPYTDLALVDYVSRLPHHRKFLAHGPSKPLLRSVFDDVMPAEILRRPKRAFHASLEHLFASPEGKAELAILTDNEVMGEIFDRDQLRAWLNGNQGRSFEFQAWLLVSLNRWLSRNIR